MPHFTPTHCSTTHCNNALPRASRWAFMPVLLLLLAIIFLISPGNLQAKEGQYRISTFTCDTSPPLDGHPLIWLVRAKTIETPLLAKGVVIENGNQRYVLCALDWCGLCNSSYELFRSKLAAGAGVDVSHVAIQCVHPHTAPYTDSDAQKLLDKLDNFPMYVDFEFLDSVTDRLAKSVKDSLARLEPFDSVGTSQAKVDRVASSRRIFVDGKLHGRMSSATNPAIIALPEGKIDPFLKTITFARGNTPLVRMHYYATHPQTRYGDPRVCSDMPGFARKRLQDSEGVFQMYFNGCGGDIAMGKYNNRSWEARDELTDRLHAGMAASAAATKYQPVKSFKWRTVDVKFDKRTDPGNRIEDNMAVIKNPKAAKSTRVRAATRVAFAQRCDKPIELTSLQINDIHILNLCGECMLEYQLYAQKQAPHDFVAVAAYGDLGPGYICTEKSFSEGGYEPSASRTSPKSEPVMKKAIRELLGEK